MRRIGGKSGSGYSLMGYKKMAAFRDRSVSITFVIKPDIPCGGLWDGRGSLQVDKAGSKWTATVLDQYKADKGLSSEQQTPILYNDMIISVMPKDGGGLRSKLVCFSPTDLHNPIWSSAADERFGLGPYLVINKHLFVFKDDGELYVYEIQSKAMKLLKKQRVMDGVDAWGPMAYADGMLVLRDAHTVKCLKIV